MTETGRPLRADAARNRHRVLGAARAVLVEIGPDASVDEIAARAGVGVGTVYRRFGDRDALVRAVVLDSVDLLVDAATRTGEPGTTPDAALTRFVLAAVDLRLGALASVLLPVMPTLVAVDETVRDRRDRLLTVVDELIDRAREHGTLRADVGVADLLLGIARASRPIPGAPAGLEATQLRRAATLLLDGLLTPTPTELDGPPGTRSELDRALRDVRGP